LDWVFSYADARKKRFQNAIPLCVLLRKNIWNGVLVHSITKIPLVLQSPDYGFLGLFR
jgi:hypothetical protein